MRAKLRAVLAFSCLVVIAGCGGGDRPPLGQVSGKVTIGGEPLVGAIVLFSPEKGRPCVGTTDQQGTYEIEYVQGVKGCVVGPAFVSFAAPTSGSVSHAIPGKYQAKSDLTVDVVKGKNNFDFELDDEKKGSPAKLRGPSLD